MPARKLPFDSLIFSKWPEELRKRWDGGVHTAAIKPSSYNRMRRGLEILFGLTGSKQPAQSDMDILIVVFETTYMPSSTITILRDIYAGLAHLWPENDWGWVNGIVRARRKGLMANRAAPKTDGARSENSLKGPIRSLRVENWPDEANRQWCTLKTAAKAPGRKSRLNKTPMADWSDAYIARVERGLGRWFLFALTTNLPAQPSPDGVKVWIGKEQNHGSAPKSIASYAFELWRGCALIWPEADWGWLSDFADELDRAAVPVRPILTGLVTLGMLRELGQNLAEEALKAPPTERNIIKFRDGLMITLLTEKPMRLRNLAALTLDDLAFDEFGGATLSVGTTKNRTDDFAYVSPDLGHALRFWIADMRPRLCPDDSCAGLWLNRFGIPLTASSISRGVSSRTQIAFGHAVSPHKFRNATAQTLALHAPENIAVASRLLGHRDGTSIAPYEGLARAAGAAKVLDDVLMDYTMPPALRKRTAS